MTRLEKAMRENAIKGEYVDPYEIMQEACPFEYKIPCLCVRHNIAYVVDPLTCIRCWTVDDDKTESDEDDLK